MRISKKEYDDVVNWKNTSKFSLTKIFNNEKIADDVVAFFEYSTGFTYMVKPSEAFIKSYSLHKFG